MVDKEKKVTETEVVEKGEKHKTIWERAKGAFETGAEKVKAFYKRNKGWINPLGAGLVLALVVGTEEAGKAELREKNNRLENRHRMDVEEKEMLAGEVAYQRELHRIKDARHAEVASEDMRLGGSLGAQDLVALREYKKAQGQDRLSA